MTSFEFIEHQAISLSLVNEIIRLKRTVWPYSTESHLEWIERNMYDNDVHLLIWEDTSLIGYLDMVKVTGSLNAWGIGNVVVSPRKQKKNIGLLLMNLCDFYLANTNTPGILICKETLIGFYAKCGWSEFNKDVFLSNNAKLSYHLFTRRLNQDMFDYLKIDRIF